MRAMVIGFVLAGMFAGTDCLAEDQPVEHITDAAQAHFVAVSIRSGAVLEVARRRWDPALRHWMFLIRCVRPGDCIPFWLSEPDVEKHPQIRSSIRNVGGIDASQSGDRNCEKNEPANHADTLVRRGQKAKLLWQAGGIRAELSAICLNDAQLGETVHARIPATGVVLRAVVIGKGRLRSDENAR